MDDKDIKKKLQVNLEPAIENEIPPFETVWSRATILGHRNKKQMFRHTLIGYAIVFCAIVIMGASWLYSTISTQLLATKFSQIRISTPESMPFESLSSNSLLEMNSVNDRRLLGSYSFSDLNPDIFSQEAQ